MRPSLADLLRQLNPRGSKAADGITIGHAVRSLYSEVSLPAALPAFIVFGANTGVGKTLVSAGLAASAFRQKDPMLYIKPIQTGFPGDSDGKLVALASGARHEIGAHAAHIDPTGASTCSPATPGTVHAQTTFAWSAPLSPHVTQQREGRPLSDTALLSSVCNSLRGFAAQCQTDASLASGGRTPMALVETAGGVCSPAPSTKLAADAYRPLRLPVVLVGDGRLGGISCTLSAVESLLLRGYDTAAVVVMDQGVGNSDFLAQHLSSRGISFFSLPPVGPHTGNIDPASGLEANLKLWLGQTAKEFDAVRQRLYDFHRSVTAARESSGRRAHESFWWPFTQHQRVDPAGVTVFDSRRGDNFLVYERDEEGRPRMRELFDGCASWWTQGMGDEMNVELTKSIAYAAGRYGHVMFPEAAHSAALAAAERLLATVGQGWASRVFFSDDGSTAIEIALKMAFRKALSDLEAKLGAAADVILSGKAGPVEFDVIGLSNAYHGDTLGAMDAVPPSPFNRSQFPAWYKGRGLFFDPPTVGMEKGQWTVRGPAGESEASGQSSLPKLRTFGSRAEVFSMDRDRTVDAETYRRHVRATIQAHAASREKLGLRHKFGAVIIEPVVQGAGGMIMPDPLFQRIMVQECRSLGIPVIMDEVFSGLFRLGVPSAWHLLGETPDIACYAKLLTGGSVPLAATVASEAIFELFKGDSKLKALLHGHSYSAHAIGCQAASMALGLITDPSTNPNFSTPNTAPRALGAVPEPVSNAAAACAFREGASCDRAAQDEGYAAGFCSCRASLGSVDDLWDASLVSDISSLPGITRTIHLGTLVAVELSGASGGYASNAAAHMVQQLRREAGVYARPLGNVIYLMASPFTAKATCGRILGDLKRVLASGAGRADGENTRAEEAAIP